MTDQNARNLSVKPPQSIWKKPLNWDLIMTADGEECIPFHIYVQPSATQSSSFPQFNRLPTELQFRILALCSAPTLFQLMHVSSTLRIEAAKLFWADPISYYLFESNWLFEDYRPCDTFYDLPFLGNVQNVEVQYQQGEDFRIDPVREGGKTSIQHDLIRIFWDTLRKRFPRVKKVIINQNWVPLLGREPTAPFSPALKSLITACPPNIDISVFIRENQSPDLENTNISLPRDIWDRSLYRQMVDGNWRKVAPYFGHSTISLPIKSFRGPVGAYQKVWYLGSKLYLQRITLGFLIVEALDRYHFDKGRIDPFSCPESGCDAYFEKAGQWTLHAARTHRPDLIVNETDADRWLKMLPEELKDAFQRHESYLVSKDRELANEVRRIHHEWNDKGPEKRKEIERRWIDQLENDEEWATGTKARKSKIWKKFVRTMTPGWWGSWFARYEDE